MTFQGPSEADVRRELAEEESQRATAAGYVAQHDVTTSGFIGLGLEVEESQYVVDYPYIVHKPMVIIITKAAHSRGRQDHHV